MATIGTRRSGKDVDMRSSQPGSNKSASAGRAAAASREVVDKLTPEEEYLLKVFRRYRDAETAAAVAAAAASKARSTDKQLYAKRSPSPVPDRAKAIYSPTSRPVGGGNEGAKSDAFARTKMILMEKKRKAAAVGLSRVGSAAGAGGLKKAKINKIVGALSSVATVMLDPVKYPASGLLLTQEYRTFKRADSAGDQDYEPTESFVKNLKNFGLVEDGGGGNKASFSETLVMRVTVPAHSQSWGVNICPPEHKDFSEVLFHFNPRRRFVAMNSREDNIWGQQEKFPGAKWPDLFNVSINLAMQIDEAGFHIAIDGKYCATFRTRREFPANGSDLILQIMTADDYGTNLGLIIHEMWWGHKQTMPGRPGSLGKERQPARAADPWRAGENSDNFVDLHVGNLPSAPSPEQQEAVRKRLNDIFQPYGAIQVRVLYREKSFGFVKFRDHEGAAKALEELSGVEIHGRIVRLSIAASSGK